MPGLNQLKKFSDDIREIGDEVKIRAQRGEKVPEIPLPQGISEADDSNDFLIGLPDGNAEPAAIASEEDIDAQIQDIIGGGESDIDALLKPQISADDDDLADFLNDDSLSAPTEDLTPADGENEKSAPEETPLEDMDLDSLLKPSDPESESNAADDSNLNSFDDFDSLSSDDASLDEIDLNEDIPDSVLESDGIPPVADTLTSAPDFSADDLGGLDSPDSLDQNSGDTSLDLGGFDIDSLINGDGSEDSPDDSLTDAALAALGNSGDEEKHGSESDGLETLGTDDMTLPENAAMSDLPDMDMPALPDEGEGLSEMPSDLPSDDSLSDFGELNDFASSPEDKAEGGGESSLEGDEALSSLSDMDFENPDGNIPDASMEIPDASLEVPSDGNEEVSLESFDTSGMEGVDFGPSDSASIGDEFPSTDEGLGSDDDFVLDSSFEIPGFSDTETADFGKKKSGLDFIDFSKGKEGRPKNSLTEEEYVQFKKNLANYPLNLRIALEDFIARDEFTDDAVFEIIEKVLKKTSARQLATQLEKILDVSINIPRDFERRSFAEYEAYKQSFQYHLKNRIIPAAIVGLILAFVSFGLFKAGQHFIYKPVMANIHYKQGYTLLQANEFPQSEEEFKEAVSYHPVKKWFFKYALGYRNKKQFERAGQMYRNILRFFNHDKEAGLDYAEMELYDRANYERAEEIVRREVLDYHINDADGLLLLGDVFLEWADIDESKYELAKEQYLDLIQRYGSNNVYLSRMLRYNIRTDKLREVLTYKNMLYLSKQDKQNLKNLGASDWMELSGYLLDKLYGTLSKNDEYLRSSIEDVLAMLNLAIKAEPANPVSHYNLARYFIQNGNTEQAKTELERSLDLFDDVLVRTKKNVYREINATRILGELYAGNREYLKAQTVYTRGINLYNEEHESSDLEGDENTGKLFADMGDLDYFISGEMEDALYNYEQAIEIKNDTPSINFRVGAIYYNRKDYDNALLSFIKVSEKEPNDPNMLLSLGNVLSLRGDNFAAESYYSDLLKELDKSREKQKFLLPQEDDDDYAIVDLYLKANNNLGVTLYRLAQQTGNSNMNAEAMVRLSDSIRAWDSLTRNQQTMIRMEGSNLAAQNSKYITHPHPDFEPAIYTDIPRLLAGEKGLE
ncbi:MAG: tetratricopeptide repeat protein [Treponema sp.]|nr:tetratricopeptide repeat protein [Treponema sp.]